MPLVSVIIITHNRMRFIDEAIASVRASTFTDYELIVVDDGSTDGTPDYVEDKYGDILTVVRKANGGPADARNHGVNKATGKYLAFLDDDDLYTPVKLEAQVALFEREDDSLGIVGGSAQFMDIDGVLFGKPQIADEHISHEQCCVKASIPGIFSSVMTRRSLWQQVGGMDKELRRSQDIDYVIRASKLCRIMNVKDIVVHTRVHDTPRVNVNLETVIRCRRIIFTRIDNPWVRQRSKAWFYFTLFRRLWPTPRKAEALGWLLRSYVTWPFKLADGAGRIKETLMKLSPSFFVSSARKTKHALLGKPD